MAVRQYIGARYVTKVYENSQNPGSAEWEPGVTYEPLTLVTYQYSSYLSKKEVPGTIGDPASNSGYWVVTGAYNGQIATLQNEINTARDNELFFNVCFPPASYPGPALDNTGATDVTTDLQSMINYVGSNGGGCIYFPAGTYWISRPLTVTSSKIKFLGSSYAASVLLKDADDEIFDVQTTIIEFNTLLFRNTYAGPGSDNVAIKLKNTTRARVYNCGFYNFNTGIYMDRARGSKIEGCSFVWDSDGSQVVNVYAIKMTDNCASSRILHCAASFDRTLTVSSYGIFTDTHAQDIFIDDFETAYCTYSISLKNTTSINPGDIRIRNCTFDLVRGRALYLEGIKAATYKNTSVISDIYITPYVDIAELLYINDSDGVSLSDVVINNPQKVSTVTDVGIRLYNSNDISVTGCVITGLGRGIRLNATTHATFTGCTVAQCDGLGTNGLVGGGVDDIIVTGCVFDVLNSGISFDNTCNRCIATSNNCHGSQLNNLATGGITDNNIT